MLSIIFAAWSDPVLLKGLKHGVVLGVGISLGVGFAIGLGVGLFTLVVLVAG